METILDVLERESLVRFGCFGVVLVVMTVWELAAPRRRLSAEKPLRWLSNLSLLFLNALLLRLALPLGAVGTALLAQENGWGLFHAVELPFWLVVVFSVIVLDFVIYLQHVLFHALPILWRLHMVHHADLDFDVSTGLRFHTIEIIISMGIKMTAVVLLGAPVFGVLIFEIVLNGTAMFNHSNVRLPIWLDRFLRLAVVTPDMHRVHHSIVKRETNSNYGFNAPWWDYLFGTYRAQPEAGHEKMTIGLEQIRNEKQADRLHWMIALPFVGRGATSTVSKHEMRQPDGSDNDETTAPRNQKEQALEV